MTASQASAGTPDERFDVIVVGAGFGGATCAALLAQRGRKVLLLDRNPSAGGKAMTLRRNGDTYEMWPIVGGPATGSRIAELLNVIGVAGHAPLLTPERSAELRYIRPDGSVLTTSLGALPGSAMTPPPDPAIGPAEIEAAGAMAIAMLSASDEDLALLDELDAASWMSTFAIGPTLAAHQLTLLNLIFVAAVDRIPASEAIRTVRDFGLKGAGRYHAGGYARPAEVAAEYVAAHGGAYRPRTTVERILVEGGRATGVVAGGETIEARAVISNAGIQPTVLGLVGPEHFPASYVERTRRLEPSWAFVGLRYFLDAPLMEVGMVLQFSDQSWWDTARFRAAERGSWPEHPLLFVVTPGLYDPTLVRDPSHQIVLAGTMSSPDPRSPMGAQAIRRVDAEMRATWPEITSHVRDQEVFSASNVSAAGRASVLDGQGGECIGLAQVIGQCGASKPHPATPIEGLFLVGCDAGGYGCGTHQATESGFVVADLVDTALAGSDSARS